MNELELNIRNYFGIIEEEEIKTISRLFQKTTLEKGDFYLKTGGMNNKLSFVQSGYLRVFAYTENKEITQWISTQGYFVTDLASLLFDHPARWNIQALTDAVLYTISQEDYLKIGKLVANWHELEKLFMGKCFTMMEDRIFSHLSMSAEERYIYFFEQHKELFNQIPLQYIASMLGMTPETFSRIRKKQIS